MIFTRDMKKVLSFLAEYQGRWCTHGNGHGTMPTIADTIPYRSSKEQHAIMCKLWRRGFVGGCTCGCRGDWEITNRGLEKIGVKRVKPYNGYGER